MTWTTERNEGVGPLRRMLTGASAGTSAEQLGEHLHYDRNARAWRTHEELLRPRAEAPGDRDAVMAECA
jgi:hypothetical protein